MKKYYPSIQILRGVFFLSILAFHCNIPYFNLGWGAVESFFVISTFFLVRKQWENPDLNVKKQMLHRILRLYPPYIAILIIAVLYALVVKEMPYDLPIHLLSAQNYQWMITGYISPMQPMTAHTWTLSIEIWGGVAILILLKVLSPKSFKFTMYIMLALAIGYRVITIICGANVWIISLCPVAHFDAFACGALLAIEMREKKVVIHIERAMAVTVIGIAGIIACILVMANRNNVGFMEGYMLTSVPQNYLDNWFTGNLYLFISLFTVGLVWFLCLHDEKDNKTNKNGKVFLVLGNNSYVLYLFHWPIIVVIQHFFQNKAIVFVVTFIISVVISCFWDIFYSEKYKKLLKR